MVGIWVAGIDDVSEVELTDWEADDSAVEVVSAVGMEDVCVVEVVVVLVRGGV
ncbi:hypothetical protein KI387_032895, partial [Taxus chinensis]